MSCYSYFLFFPFDFVSHDAAVTGEFLWWWFFDEVLRGIKDLKHII